MKNKTVKRIASLVAIVLVIGFFSSYIIYHLVNSSNTEIKTEFALKETVYKTIDAKCFVVRDEEFIKNDAIGTSVSFVNDGDRVARGDTVSVVFDSSEDAAAYLKTQELKKSIEHYEELSGQANFQPLNINSLTKKINNELTDYLDAVDTRDFSKAISSVELFRDSVTGKQIATGKALDLEDKLTGLNEELNSLNSNGLEFTEIKTENAGYFISGSDGYESTLKFEDVDDLTVKDVKKAIKSKPQKIDSDIVGRTVSSFKWYIVCVLNSDEMVDITNDKNIYLNFPESGIEKLSVKVHKIGDRSDKETVVVFSCDEMNESLSDFRIEKIEIITDEYSGFKISNSSIRTLDGVQGVYIVRGNLMGFRKIKIIHTTDDYSIVENPENSSGYIKLYDKVVTEGVDLYDNKLI
ncbi:MAG: HlyD family efflux transporter periplasmic adaptor subunit [Acutalibacteraceae bacterium]|nr:HlyD family efflux transporter periplasmic adaptor subunit [Acutalibacteraceae bacterium]